MLHMGFPRLSTCHPNSCDFSLWLVISIPSMISGILIQEGDALCIDKCYYHNSFTRLLFWKVSVVVLAGFILSISPARLGKAIICNFCCGQPQILVRLIRYDLLRNLELLFGVPASSITVLLHTYIYGERAQDLQASCLTIVSTSAKIA